MRRLPLKSTEYSELHVAILLHASAMFITELFSGRSPRPIAYRIMRPMPLKWFWRLERKLLVLTRIEPSPFLKPNAGEGSISERGVFSPVKALACLVVNA